MTRTAALATTAAVVLATLPSLRCATPSPHLRTWLEVRTPGLAVWTPLEEDDALDLVRDVEVIRSVVAYVTGESLPRNPSRLRVFVFDHGDEYRLFLPSRWMSEFDVSMRRTTIAVSGAPYPISAREILEHEYARFLLVSLEPHQYPPWLLVGASEIARKVRVEEDGVEIGRPPAAGRFSFPPGDWIPVENLLSLRDPDELRWGQAWAFRIQAWALVHYLYFGRPDANARTELGRYLEALQGGASDYLAAERAVGSKPAALGEQLMEYIAEKHFPHVTLPIDQARAEPPRTRILTRAETANALGELYLRHRRYEQALALYSAVLAEDPGSAAAKVGIANALSGQGRWREAESHYQEALALGSDDAFVHLDYANHLRLRAQSSEDATQRSDLAERARTHCTRSLELDASVPETHATYGATFLLEGQDAARGRAALERAHELLPASLEISMLLTRLYAKLGRWSDAREVALQIRMGQHAPTYDAAIDALFDAGGVALSEGQTPRRGRW